MAEPREPERLLIVARVEGAEPAAARYLLLRASGDEQPRLLSLDPPLLDEPWPELVRETLELRLGLSVVGDPELSEHRLPLRFAQPRAGRTGTGWLRGVAARVAGAPDPQPPLAGVELLTLDEAEAALATSAEREILRATAALLEEPPRAEPS